MIKVIDLFAGPGGLAEGFSSVKDENNIPVFDIKLSIEKDEIAHKTLTLRSFYRQFIKAGEAIPEEYYKAIRETDIKVREKKIDSLYIKFTNEGNAAKAEAQKIELGDPKFPNSYVDDRIRKALKKDKNWVLIGGPPCQAYSLVGRSRRQWKDSVDEEDKRVFLYREYLRIIAFHHPSVFVMENVKGMLSAELDGTRIFEWIKRDLKNPGILFPRKGSPKYRIFSFATGPASYDSENNPIYKSDKDYLIKTEKYGIPQKRHRVILLGIREDIDVSHDVLKERDNVSLESVIGLIPPIRSSVGRRIKSSEIINGRIKREYQKIDNSDVVWKALLEGFRREIINWNGLSDSECESFLKSELKSTGGEFVKTEKLTLGKNHPLYSWIYDPNLRGLLNHETRSHLLEDLNRYLFLSIYTQLYSNFPRLHDYKKYSDKLMPEHQSATSGKFSDRFRVQLPGKPATTITSHISKDGHYYIHYDPSQCRSMTVREAARIQTFPDNYLFCGSRTAQYHQVGNAVPPYLSKQIGDIVKKILLNDK